MSVNLSHRSMSKTSPALSRGRGKKKQDWDSYVKDDSLYQLSKEQVRDKLMMMRNTPDMFYVYLSHCIGSLNPCLMPCMFSHYLLSCCCCCCCCYVCVPMYMQTQMLARKKLFVSKNNILAKELTPEERARIAARALRKERAAEASTRKASLNRTRKGVKKPSVSKNKGITTIYKSIDDVQGSDDDTVNKGEELTVLDVLDDQRLVNGENHDGSDSDEDDDDTTSTPSTVDKTFRLHDNSHTKRNKSNVDKKMASSKSSKVSSHIKLSSSRGNASTAKPATPRSYICNQNDKDQSYTADEMQDISDLLRSLVTEMKYYETVTGRCVGGGSFDSEELNAIIEDESSTSPLNVKGAMLFLTQLVSQTMTHLLRSEIDLKVSREQYDMLSKRIENLEMASSSVDSDLNKTKGVKFFESPIQDSHSNPSQGTATEHAVDLSYDLNDVTASRLTRRDLTSMFNEDDGGDTPIVGNSPAANEILQQYAFGNSDRDVDKEDDESSYGEPAESDDGSELEASFTSENIDISNSSSALVQQHLMTGTSTSDWIFKGSPAREPTAVSATTTYRVHQESPSRVNKITSNIHTDNKATLKKTFDTRWK